MSRLDARRLLAALNDGDVERVLLELDYEIVGMDDFEPEELVQPDLEGLTAGGSWVLETKLGRLDIHLEPEIDYSALDAGAIEDEVFGMRVRFCGYAHLVEMKRAAGRDRDHLDLAELETIREPPPDPEPEG